MLQSGQLTAPSDTVCPRTNVSTSQSYKVSIIVLMTVLWCGLNDRPYCTMPILMAASGRCSVHTRCLPGAAWKKVTYKLNARIFKPEALRHI